MDSNDVIIALACIIIMYVILMVIEKEVASTLIAKHGRISDLYQGGELVEPIERRYRLADFDLNIYFMILHVIGFFGASLFILIKYQYEPLSWLTISFGGLILYTILIIRQAGDGML